MVKIVNFTDVGEIESQRQIDEYSKQYVVGESLLDFESLNIGSGHVIQDFKAEMIHQSIEMLVVHLYQLLDESGETIENEEEIKAYLIESITNHLRLINVRIEDNLQPIGFLFDSYLKGNYIPEILTTVFVLCSMDIDNDNRTDSIASAIDRLIMHHRTHGDTFVKALKHAWNPLLDEKLKEALNDINNTALARDLQTILDFRNENHQS